MGALGVESKERGLAVQSFEDWLDKSQEGRGARLKINKVTIFPNAPMGATMKAIRDEWERANGVNRSNMTDEEIARVCHQANRGLCAAFGDHSQPDWEDAPEWARTSAVKGVAFTRANPEAPPSASHESWLAEKEATGWKYGPVKDPEKKEHPCFVPYDELPPEQKAKDYVFQAVARALISAPTGAHLQVEFRDDDGHSVRAHLEELIRGIQGVSVGGGTDLASLEAFERKEALQDASVLLNPAFAGFNQAASAPAPHGEPGV